MQKWACMAVHAISYRKAPLRQATVSQFGPSSASTSARGLSVLVSAGHAWDATSSRCAPERWRPPRLPTPSKRSHTHATY